MIYNVYAMHDRCTGFLSPTLELNDDAALRHFEHALSQPVSDLFSTHPEDFSLYCIGSYDTNKGSLDPLVPVVLVITGAQALQRYAARTSHNKEA